MKEQCPDCAAEGLDKACDNLVTFADTGIKFCIASHGTLSKNTQPISLSVKTQPLSNPSELLEGEYSAIKSRGLTRKTCEYAGYMINRDKGVHIANYYDDTGTVKMQQLRTGDKQFPLLGDKSFNQTLWGMHQYPANKNVFLTITEGQIDRLSVLQAFDCKYPVVSLPNGVKSAAKVLEKNMKKLLGFKHLVLAFDNDEPGRQATKECLALFDPGFVKVAHWVKKDANDHLMAGEVAEIRNTVYNAVEFIPPCVITGQALLDTLKDFKPKSLDWPWASFRKFLNPIYVPGIYTIAGLPGVGKTILMAEIMRSVVERGAKVGVISLEESVQRMLLKLTSLITGVDLKGIRNRQITEEEIELCRSTADSIVTYDHKAYGSDLLTIVDNLPYIAKSLDCEVIIFDNLSYSATGAGDDERRAIDKAMISLKDSSTKYEYVLFNICHLNDDGEEGGSGGATIRGSRGVQMYSDYVIHLSRDTEADNLRERNLLTFHVKKDRESGEDTGKSVKLRYNPNTQRLEDL